MICLITSGEMSDDPVVSTSLCVLEFPDMSGNHSLLHRAVSTGDSLNIDLYATVPKIVLGEALRFYGQESSLGLSQLIVKFNDTTASLYGFANKKYIFTSTINKGDK